MRNKSITRFAAFFVAATMLFACLQVIAQPAANDSGHTYVLVDQPTDGGVYLMISRQSGSNFAVSGTADARRGKAWCLLKSELQVTML